MPQIIAVHSFRGGTGKSNTVANMATVLASEGRRVGVVDTDILSPGIHVLFGLDETQVTHSLNDYLWGRCDIKQATYDVTPELGAGPSTRSPLGSAGQAGRIYLIPSSLKAGEIARILREGYDAGLLNDGLHKLIKDQALDVLLIDTHPGLNEETLLSIAIADAVVIVLRPDQQDYQGTGVTVEVARKLGVPHMALVVNKTPQAFDPGEVKARVEKAYNCPVIAVLPHSDDLMALASSGLFVLRFPDHPISAMLRDIVRLVVSEPAST